jgi:hypothetical protein
VTSNSEASELRGRGAAERAALGAGDLGLFAGTVLIWSTTWLALKFQLGIVDPQVSIVWRFAIAAPLMFLVAKIAGARLVFPLRMHLRFALLDQFHPLLQRRALRRVGADRGDVLARLAHQHRARRAFPRRTACA